MADYQEYRRRILHRRWRRVFIIVALLALVALLSAIVLMGSVSLAEKGLKTGNDLMNELMNW